MLEAIADVSRDHGNAGPVERANGELAEHDRQPEG
jgi:hypothetical protein